jgi:hypothetical protein
MPRLIGPGAQAGGRGLALACTLLRVLLAAFFAYLAARNLSGDQRMADDFRRWGYADWFRGVTAILQVAGAAALLVPATRMAGALLLTGVLVGALATHLRHDPPASAVPAAVVLVLLLVSLLRR